MIDPTPAVQAYYAEHPELDPRFTSLSLVPDGDGGYQVTGHMPVDRTGFVCCCCGNSYEQCTDTLDHLGIDPADTITYNATIMLPGSSQR